MFEIFGRETIERFVCMCVNTAQYTEEEQIVEDPTGWCEWLGGVSGTVRCNFYTEISWICTRFLEVDGVVGPSCCCRKMPPEP